MPTWKFLMVIVIVVCIAGGLIAGFYYFEKYVRKQAALEEKSGVIELLHPPFWLNETLKERIKIAAADPSGNLKIDDKTAARVQQRLAGIEWMADVRVRTTEKGVLVDADWRQPFVSVESFGKKVFVTNELVVLDYIEMANLPIVEVAGLPGGERAPAVGSVWHLDDLAAAVELVVKLYEMDIAVTPDKPLLFEIDRIDISNLGGRKSSSKPHIVLYTKDETQIQWGARLGSWQRFMEVPDEEKLAKLYNFYKETNTLSGGVKYINLYQPQGIVPQPIDTY